MAQLERDHAALEQQCRAAVNLLVEKYGWRLLDRDELTGRTLDRLRAGLTTDPQRAAIGVYSLALHTACSGVEGAERQNLGYAELARYLFDLARWRYADVCEDATQSALERIYRSFDRCRLPIAFLAFAIQHLVDAARAARRREHRQPQPLDPRVADEAFEDAADAPDGPLEHALSGERRQSFERQWAEFMQAHPRASEQLTALWMKYIDGLDDAAISERLGVPIDSVYVRLTRARQKLRADPRWRALAAEFGIVQGER